MDYLETLKTVKKEVENIPREAIRAELNKELSPEIRKIYRQNLEELWYGDDICEYIGIDYYDLSDENVIKVRYIALLAAKRGVCIEKNVEPVTIFSFIRSLFSWK